MPAPPEIVKISWKANPPGQLGTRPQRIPLNGQFQVQFVDEGELKIEFIGGSPLKNGQMFVNAGEIVDVVKPGKFKFKCHLTVNGQELVLDPDDPKQPDAGGSMDVPPDTGTKTS
jgi:hypothetical protein